MRASNARDSYEFLGREYPAVHRHLEATLPVEVLDRMKRGLRTEWIPVELDGQYVDAVHAFMGPDPMKAAYRRFIAESLTDSPMIRALFDGVVRVFGVGVGSFLRALPNGLRQSYQDAFTLEMERGDHEALVVFDDIAPEVLRFSGYPVVWEAVFLGMYDLARTAPQLDFKVRRGSRRMEARFRW
jgi:hypothetical protein